MATFEQINIGDIAERTTTITDEMIRLFAQCSGDTNPVHLDEEYAKKTQFGERIAHGILVTGLISAVMGCDLPGEGAIYLSQTVNFLRPVKIGDVITARVEVIEKIDGRNKKVKFRTYCINQHGKIVIDGDSTGIPPVA
jgi:3-hydroxybutyryl-CoA dehydratase